MSAPLRLESFPSRIIGSDFGQVLHVNSIDGMRIFIRGLLGFGVTTEQVKVMLQENPARLMYLDDSPTSERTPDISGYGESIRRWPILAGICRTAAPGSWSPRVVREPPYRRMSVRSLAPCHAPAETACPALSAGYRSIVAGELLLGGLVRHLLATVVTTRLESAGWSGMVWGARSSVALRTHD